MRTKIADIFVSSESSLPIYSQSLKGTVGVILGNLVDCYVRFPSVPLLSEKK